MWRARGRHKRRNSVTLAELGDYPLNIPSRPHAMRMSVETALASVDLQINWRRRQNAFRQSSI
jgi:hypothetical protein